VARRHFLSQGFVFSLPGPCCNTSRAPGVSFEGLPGQSTKGREQRLQKTLDLLRFYSSLSQRFVREFGATVTRVPLNKHPLHFVSGETASAGAAGAVRTLHRQVDTEIFLSPSALIADPLF
jgi:hypothetical protein